MQYEKLRSVGLFWAVLLYAAGFSLPSFASDENTKTPIKSVALLKISDPREFPVFGTSSNGNAGAAGAAFGGIFGGVIGGVMDASKLKKLMSEQTATLSSAINERDVKFGAILANDLQESLRNAGITVQYLENQSPAHPPDKKTPDFSQISTDADLIIYVWVLPIYTNVSNPQSLFRPTIAVMVKIIDNKTKLEISQKQFVYGRDSKTGISVKSSDNPKYLFKNFEDLVEHVDTAIEGTIEGESLISNVIAKNLSDAPTQ